MTPPNSPSGSQAEILNSENNETPKPDPETIRGMLKTNKGLRHKTADDLDISIAEVDQAANETEKAPSSVVRIMDWVRERIPSVNDMPSQPKKSWLDR